jgi:CRISPR-associated protein Cas1
MKRHQNTLFITTQGSYLSKEGECVVVHVEGSVVGKIPIHTIGNVVCFGQLNCSPFLLGHCADNGVAISFLTENGRYMASVQGPVSGNVLLRREQYRRADCPKSSASIAQAIVAGKIANCRTVLRRSARDRESARLTEAADRLTMSLSSLAVALPLDTVRGVEGEAANTYFGVFNHMISEGRPSFHFTIRSRRPPLDRINCLLSFLYTLLMHDVRSALECTGLDPAVGFLHRDRPGRPSLALDLMEEFRPYVADRLALTLVNRGQIAESGFTVSENGAVFMSDATRKSVILAWQERKKEEVEPPFLQERMAVGLLWHMQARLLARHLRGDLDAYPPFAMR